MKRTTNSHRKGGNRKRQYYRRTLTKLLETEFSIAVSRPTGDNWRSKTLVVVISDPRSSIVREFSIAAYLVWKPNYFFQQKHEKCKSFLVALVSDCFGYVFRGLYSINTSDRRQSKTIKNIDERRSKIVRNRVIDCRLSPGCK